MVYICSIGRMNPSNSSDWRNGRHVIYKLHAHVVLTPKYRRRVMTARVASELLAAFTESCERLGVTLDEFEVDTDHAHLLITYPPKLALSTLVMTLKTNSSRKIREHQWPEITNALWGKHFWSPSYAVVSCGDAPLETVANYIRNQQAPNRAKGRPKTKNTGPT